MQTLITIVVTWVVLGLITQLVAILFFKAKPSLFEFSLFCMAGPTFLLIVLWLFLLATIVHVRFSTKQRNPQTGILSRGVVDPIVKERVGIVGGELKLSSAILN